MKNFLKKTLLPGLSPRGRGKPVVPLVKLAFVGSIPAWAGETAKVKAWRTSLTVYPRVGGGNLLPRRHPLAPRGLSPRGRGKLPPDYHLPIEIRSIPAWAGETRPPGLSSSSERVYPRVGGGNFQYLHFLFAMNGLSPRGRGKRRGKRRTAGSRGSIPAWAGETQGDAVRRQRRRVYPRVGGGNPGGCSPAAAEAGLSPRGRGKHPRR